MHILFLSFYSHSFASNFASKIINYYGKDNKRT